MGHPSFSIIVPTYQRRDVVCDAVRALCKVEYRGPIELIVVVDGSTDATAEALGRLKCPFPVRIIEQDNRGAAGARNRGAAEATGNILLFLDDDMICEPDLIEQHACMYREGADAVIGATPHHPGSAPGFLSDSIARWIASEQVRSPLSPFDVFSGQLSVRASVFRQVGGFDEAFTTGAAFSNEDADLGVRLLSAFKVRHNPAAISRQRYVVGPREYMARAPKAVEGDLHFLRRNPQFTEELLGARGLTRPLGRFAYLPLSRIPFVPKILSTIAVWAAEIALKTRFRSSRLLGRFFAGSYSVAYWTALRAKSQLPRPNRLVVLCYHAIQDQSSDPKLAPYGVSPELFAQHLDVLSKSGFSFVTPDALANFLRYGAPLPRRAVLLTFDDGYETLLKVAKDMLFPRKIPAITFAVTGMRSGTNEWDQADGACRLTLLDRDQLHELAALGVAIGSHSRTHREMTLLDESQLNEEVAGSADDLASLGLPRPQFFAYPFGAVDDRGRQAVRDAGYLVGFGCSSGYVTSMSDRMDLARVGVYASDRRWRFRAKVSSPIVFSAIENLGHGLRLKVRKIGRAIGAH